MNTRKKVKVIGTETYINTETGEIKEMQVINIEERDCNFHKIWLKNMLTTIELLGTKKTNLAFWIVENLNRDNLFIMTHKEIMKKTGLSKQTIVDTMKILVETNFLQKVQIGVYRVNPDMIFKGGKADRLNILFEYQNAKSSRVGNLIKKPGEEKEPEVGAVIEMQA